MTPVPLTNILFRTRPDVKAVTVNVVPEMEPVQYAVNPVHSKPLVEVVKMYAPVPPAVHLVFVPVLYAMAVHTPGLYPKPAVPLIRELFVML